MLNLTTMKKFKKHIVFLVMYDGYTPDESITFCGISTDRCSEAMFEDSQNWLERSHADKATCKHCIMEHKKEQAEFEAEEQALRNMPVLEFASSTDMEPGFPF